MKFDIVITTYNRPDLVISLVNQINDCNVMLLSRIIVVDASESQNYEIQKLERIKYIQTPHKNQPYQRFIGYQNSGSKYLLFLDDDMEILNYDFLNEIYDLFQQKDYVAIALKFKDKHTNTSLSKIPISKLFGRCSSLRHIKNFLSGYSPKKPGKFGYNGVRGSQPAGSGFTEYVGGGAFAVQRKFMYKNFNFQLFDLYELKLGKGEDAIIGYTLSKQGNVLFYDKLLFLHNDTRTSVYSTNHYEFAKRVSFSRLYLSLERARLNNESIMKAQVVFHYYTFWRIVGYLINYLLSPGQSRKAMLFGSSAGWRKASQFQFVYSEKTNNYWKNETKYDSKK